MMVGICFIYICYCLFSIRVFDGILKVFMFDLFGSFATICLVVNRLFGIRNFY